MKLATYKDGSRDGQLVVVSRDLAQAHFATGIATRMQQLLDDWDFVSPQLEDLYATLNGGKARHAFAFDPRLAMAPLPRAYQRAEARWDQGAGAPALAQAASDPALGPTDDALLAAPEADFGAGLAAVTGDLEALCTPARALDGVRLLMLSNAWTLPGLAAADAAAGAGPLLARPATAYAPVALTPDELGEAWRGGRVHLTLATQCNGKPFGRADAAAAMGRHFGELIAQLARTRPLRAGCIVDSGVLAVADADQGYACLAAKRAREALEQGEPRSAWLQPGDGVRIEMKGCDGASLFGAIEQRLAGPAGTGGPGEAG